MPVERIFLETLDEYDVDAVRRNGLRELVSFFDAPSHGFNHGADTASVQPRETFINPGIIRNRNIECHLEPFNAEQDYTPEITPQGGMGTEDWSGLRGMDEGLDTFMGYNEPLPFASS